MIRNQNKNTCEKFDRIYMKNENETDEKWNFEFVFESLAVLNENEKERFEILLI